MIIILLGGMIHLFLTVAPGRFVVTVVRHNAQNYGENPPILLTRGPASAGKRFLAEKVVKWRYQIHIMGWPVS